MQNPSKAEIKEILQRSKRIAVVFQTVRIERHIWFQKQCRTRVMKLSL